jgi:hypothetical protein
LGRPYIENAKEAEEFAAYARGEIIDIPTVDANARADIMKRVAQANAQRESVERVRSKLQLDLSHAMQDRDAASASLVPLSMSVIVSESLPVWVAETVQAVEAANRATARLRALARLTVDLAHDTHVEPAKTTMFALAQQVRDNTQFKSEQDLDAEASAARSDLLDHLQSLQVIS